MSEPEPAHRTIPKMAEADPENELGHFSLGSAYLDAGQTGPAIQSFQRALELNPDIAKVYQTSGRGPGEGEPKARSHRASDQGRGSGRGPRRTHAEKRDDQNARRTRGESPQSRGLGPGTNRGRGPGAVQSLRPSQTQTGQPAVQQRPGKGNLRKNLRRLLARMDWHGDEGH